ncbi:hypothetical protein AB0C29_00145 [Actinoplanes sp. NPDC048791]|uniref:hypothetical protein n=1 Tax=Actinoplanes sp. NPDC048791 TaxID=3154623 RepID=UPI0033EC61BE
MASMCATCGRLGPTSGLHRDGHATGAALTVAVIGAVAKAGRREAPLCGHPLIAWRSQVNWQAVVWTCRARVVGIELRSIAVPLHAEPIRAIRADAALWEQASTWPPFSPRRGEEALPEISRDLLAVVPAGAGWVDHFDGRCFQQAEYLMDPVAYRTQARTWRERERTVAYRIVTGDDVFADHARTGQGFAWRCSTKAFLVAAVQHLDSLDVDAVRQGFSVAEMDALGLYKVHAGEDDDKAFTRVLTQLREFAEHRRTVAAKNLDLIITLY